MVIPVLLFKTSACHVLVSGRLILFSLPLPLKVMVLFDRPDKTAGLSMRNGPSTKIDEFAVTAATNLSVSSPPLGRSIFPLEGTVVVLVVVVVVGLVVVVVGLVVVVVTGTVVTTLVEVVVDVGGVSGIGVQAADTKSVKATKANKRFIKTPS